MRSTHLWPHRPFPTLLLLFTLFAAPLLYSAQTSRAAQLSINITDYKYNPSNISIPVGTTVIWSNTDSDTHNIAIDEGPELYVSPVLKRGDTARFLFTRIGNYHIFCEWHPQMQAIVIVIASGNPTDVLPPHRARAFPETGKAIRGKFLDYWQSRGGLTQQGYPLSEEITEKSDTDGKFYTVQYMERAVFELHPENAPPNDVLLTLLGQFRYKQKYPGGAPAQQVNTGPGSVLFKETGKRLGGEFLLYWQRNGGLAQQGFPISDEFQEKSDLNGRTYRVQYFERAIFEFHPENKPPYDVLLSQLGKFRYDKVSEVYKATSGIYPVGVSSAPQHYPLLAGPHAAAGVNAWIYENDPKPVVQMVKDLGTNWVLHQLSWYQIEPERGKYKWEKIDRAVDELRAAGVNVILHPVHAPQWSWPTGKVGYPTDPADFGRFMSAAVQRYRGKVAGYQIWNEPNFARETGPYASASHYGTMLKAGYLSVKAADPKAIVILGALTPTGLNDPFTAVDDVLFLKRLYAYNGGELKGYFDVLGAHPGSNANPPDTLWPDKPGPGPGWTEHGSFYFRRIEQLRQIMVENGDAAKQMWLTEFGWMSMAYPPPGFEFAAQNTEQEQADFIGRAFRMGRDQYPWMGPMMVFNLNFALTNVATGPDDERIGWSLLRPDGSKRPSYAAVKEYAGGK